jgi:hypothetical protein
MSTATLRTTEPTRAAPERPDEPTTLLIRAKEPK